MPRFTKSTQVAAPAAEVFAWHERPGAFERLAPPWETVRVVERHGSIHDGDQLIMEMGTPPATIRWVAEHRDYRPGESFCDVQVSGPFARWEHTHRIEAIDETTSTLIDEIDYEFPMGALGNLAAGKFTRSRLERMFRYRHTTTAGDIATHTRNRSHEGMKILVSGSNGLLGSALIPFLSTGGHSVTPLLRSAGKSNAGPSWDPARGEIESDKVENFDAVVHLAGESIAEGRWTEAKKKRILDSRVEGTKLLASTLASLKNPPKALICASAVGYYGDRGDEEMSEDSGRGSDFLSVVCEAWENAAGAARDAGIRVVHLRFGVVLSARGGALTKMLLPFKLGVGGVIGSGDQYVSWIALDDAIGCILHALTNETLEGPVNAVAPNPVTNHQLTKVLGSVLSRPTLLPLPAFAAKIALGEMADELLLSSTRVAPRRLLESGYSFRFSDLKDALQHETGT